MLTLAQHLDLIRHGLGAAPDSRHNLYETFNRAGRELCGFTRWSWLKVLDASVLVSTGAKVATLPADFEELLAARRKDGFGLRIVSEVELSRLRDISNLGAPNTWCPHVCFVPTWTFNDAGVTAKQLQLSDAPASDTEIQLDYYRGWIEMAAGDANKVPRVPPEWEDALATLALGFAKRRQDEGEPVEIAQAMADLERLRQRDGSRQLVHGRVRGGAMTRDLVFSLPVFKEVDL